MMMILTIIITTTGDDDDDEDSTKVVPVSIKSVKLFMDAKLFPKKARLTRCVIVCSVVQCVV